MPFCSMNCEQSLTQAKTFSMFFLSGVLGRYTGLLLTSARLYSFFTVPIKLETSSVQLTLSVVLVFEGSGKMSLKN